MPVLQFDQDDRIIYSDEIIGKDNSDLMEISWEEFETLIRDWLRKEFNSETTKTEVTQASRDGGVDAIVFDTDYLKGGKTVVQVKQYSNVVPVHAARDLWGVMNHENASRGILVTTSHFGPDTYEFTKDKPISLVNGEQLIDYLKKHNFIYKIGKRTNEYHKFY